MNTFSSSIFQVAERREYDIEQNIHRVYDGNDDVITFTRTSFQPFTEYIDGNNNRYEYNLDEETNTASIVYPDGTFENRTFDENGFLVGGRDRNGLTSSFQVNEEGATVERANEQDDDVFFMYNDRGLVTEATNGVGTIKITYTSSGAPRTVQYPDGKTFTYDYDDQDRRIAIRDGEGYHSKYSYDTLNRVIDVTDGQTGLNLVNVEYDQRGPISKRTFPNGCETSYAYKTGGSILTRVLNFCGSTVVSQFDYGYNQRFLRQEINTTQGTWNVRYDGADQIRSWSDPQGNEVSIAYDGAGNRRSMDVNGDVTSYVVNSLNQYEQIGDVAVMNDENGNIIEMQDTISSASYEFNVYNQITASSQMGGEDCVYNYNAMGVLHETICAGVSTRYYMDLFGEIDANVLIEVIILSMLIKSLSTAGMFLGPQRRIKVGAGLCFIFESEHDSIEFL